MSHIAGGLEVFHSLLLPVSQLKLTTPAIAQPTLNKYSAQALCFELVGNTM